MITYCDYMSQNLYRVCSLHSPLPLLRAPQFYFFQAYQDFDYYHYHDESVGDVMSIVCRLGKGYNNFFRL